MIYFILWSVFIAAIILAVPIASMLEKRGVDTAEDMFADESAFDGGEVPMADAEFGGQEVAVGEADFASAEMGDGGGFADDDDFKNFG